MKPRHRSLPKYKPRPGAAGHSSRRGYIAVLAAFILVVIFGFVALGVDTGMIVLEKTDMQNASDAAALAAAQELSQALKNFDGQGDPTAYALAQAKLMASEVAEANGAYVDPDKDVEFGSRSYNKQADEWSINWGQGPYNVVKVNVRRDQADTSLPDGKVPMTFGWAVGRDSVSLKTSATAYVDSRDVVVVLDFSGSMNDDSEFLAVGKLDQYDVEANMEDIYEALNPDLGSMEFEPKWLTLDGPEPTNQYEAQVSVTFKRTEVSVESTKNIEEVTLVFDNGRDETFSVSGTSVELSGTGYHSDNIVEEVYVVSGETPSDDDSDESVTISGDPPQTDTQAQVYVTFYGESIYVESSKDLSNVVLEFSDGIQYKFDSLNVGTTATFEGVGTNAGKWITKAWVKSGDNASGDGPGYGERFENPLEEPNQSDVATVPQVHSFEDTVDNVIEAFGLDEVDYPYSSGNWSSFIGHCRNDGEVRDAGYRRKYGGMCFVDYLLQSKPKFSQTADLWKTPSYPFHAVKNGVSLFLDYLGELGLGDEVGLVSYDEESRVESTLNFDGYNIDLGDNPITDNYEALDAIQTHRQASHFGTYTGMGYGVEEGRVLLVGDSDEGVAGYARDGARHTMVLMTDGQANRYPSHWSLPHDFEWADWTDFDGDGYADYTTDDRAKQYAFWQATETIEEGVTIHTMSVGAGADEELMEAIAFAGGGVWIHVPGGSTVAEMQDQLLTAFAKIAGMVPAPKLAHAEE